MSGTPAVVRMFTVWMNTNRSCAVAAALYADARKLTAIFAARIAVRIRIRASSAAVSEPPYRGPRRSTRPTPAAAVSAAMTRKITQNRPRVFASASAPPSVRARMRYRVTAEPTPNAIRER